MKATPDGYRPRPMKILCQEALEILRESDDPLRCGYLGDRLFREAVHRGSAPFARIAGKVMRRLEKVGLAEYGNRGDVWGWRVTAAGRRCDYHE